jgi:hypothetical protein
MCVEEIPAGENDRLTSSQNLREELEEKRWTSSCTSLKNNL